MSNDTAVAQEELSFDENVALIMRDLPVPVQEFLTGPERDQTVLRLSNKYGLHADQAGTFQRSFLFMLMGIHSPEQFLSDLKGAGIGEETARSLAADVNEEVFKPLQAKVIAPPTPRPTPPPTYTPAAPVVQAPAYVPPAPAVPPPPPAPVAATPAPVVPQPLPAAEEHPSMRTMATDMQAVKEHRDPEPMPYQPPAPPHFVPPPAPAPPPPVRVAPPPVPPPPAARTTPPPPSNLPGAPVVHEYSVDPYREPLE